MLRYRYIPSTLLALTFSIAVCQSDEPVKADAEGQGDPIAAIIRHYETHDLPETEIIKKFEALAAEGDVRGTMWLARSYLKGRCSLPEQADLAQEMAKGVISRIIAMAQNGDKEAQFLLGSAYQEGLGVDQDFAQAAKWYEQLIESKHPTALNNFANMLAFGHGVEPDIDRARGLFSEAAAAGSLMAAKNLAALKDDGRDDTQRLATLRTNTLVQALGMQKEDGIQLLHEKGLLTDPKKFRTTAVKDTVQYHFRIDGLLLSVGPANRIVNVEAHGKDFRGSRQFRGEIPLGVTWDDTQESTRNALGRPDSSGCVASDGAYGLAYRMENVFFAVMFSPDGKSKVKLWRAHEKWAATYPPLATVEKIAAP